MASRPRLRTVLLTVNLLILLLPLLGIAALRLYENELIRSTEAQLYAQAVFARELYRLEYLRRENRPAEPQAPDPADAFVPALDVSRDPVLDRAPLGEPPSAPADPVAVEAGAAMAEILRTNARESLAGIRVVDRGGIVVATSGSEEGLSIARRDEVARALRGERVSVLRRRVSDEPTPPLASMSRGQRYRVFVALPVRDGERVLGAVIVSRTPLDIGKALYLNRRPVLLGAAAILGVVFVVSLLTALTIARPTRALIDQANRVARGEPGASVGVDSVATEEMAQLSRAIGSMARTLQERADYIRAFAAHVSHEFKTPLTTIRGTVELLQDHLSTMTPEERDRFLTIVEEASDRLDRLVRRLHDLARADVLVPKDERTDVAAAIGRIAGPDVTVEIAPGLGSVRMAEETFAEILQNLLDNARVHGGPGVAVRVSARAVDGAIEIAVRDSGPGISEANAERVFTPFFTTARERGGSGLGLPIVRSLLASHGGTIRLDRGSPGTTFVVRIPG